MDRAPHPAFGPRAAALSRDPVRAVGRPTCLSRDSRTYFLMVSEKPGVVDAQICGRTGTVARSRQNQIQKISADAPGIRTVHKISLVARTQKRQNDKGSAVTRVTRVTRRRVTNVTRVTRVRPKKDVTQRRVTRVTRVTPAWRA